MNPKLALGLGVLFLLIVSNAFVGYKAFGFGADSVQTKWDAAELARARAEAEADKTILKQKPKVKHENQNRDRAALVRHICKRGWVQRPEQCTPYR